MKKNILFITSLLILHFFISTIVVAQVNTVGNFISAGTADATKLLGAYLKPYANAFGADLTGGWYNTAKVHKTLGFDLTLTINTAFVPKDDKSFDVSKLGLVGTYSGNPTAPTVAGKNEQGPLLEYRPTINGTPVLVASFHTPKGTGIGVIPSPMLQLGIGIVKGTELIGRFVPKVNIGDNGSVDAWGIGLKHSIKQWIPGIKNAPFFHFSFFGGYTQLRTNVKNLNFKPSFYNSLTPVPPDRTGSTNFNNQEMELKVKGLTFNILASFDLPVVTFYGGIGISNTKTTLKLKGNYPIIATSGANAGSIVVITDPINMEMKSTNGSSTKPRLNGGIKFKLSFITIHFDYTYANYSIVTAGLGISVR